MFWWGTFGQVRLGELMLVVFGCVAVSFGEAGTLCSGKSWRAELGFVRVRQAW